MKIQLNKNDKLLFDHILETKDLNIEVSDILMDAFQYVDFVNKDVLEEKFKNNKSLKEAICEIIIENFDIKDEKLISAIFERVSVKECNPESYKNKYIDYISDKNFHFKNYKLKKISYEPYQLFALDEISLENDLLERLNIGFFNQDLSYIALFENNNLWMSVNPNEIETMKRPIANAHGNVLVLGLGMGYVAYMMSQQKNVKSITIIEKNRDNIDAMKNITNDLFKGKNIKIINAHAIEYLKANHNFDYIFADLWFSPEDGIEPYLKLNDLENKYSIKIDYWLETSLKQMKRRYLIELINEQLNGSNEEQYKSEKTLPDRVFKKLYYETKDVCINSINDIKELLK